MKQTLKTYLRWLVTAALVAQGLTMGTPASSATGAAARELPEVRQPMMART